MGIKKGNKLFRFGLIASAAALMLGACSSDSEKQGGKGADGKETITFINHKTDWTGNGKWDEYIAQFNEKHPDIEVKVETITDYAGQMQIRMNSKDYGDVLMVPTTIKPEDNANFFEPLGDQKELEEKYLLLTDRAYDGVSYGIPIAVNTTGVLVNMKVFNDAGITEFPKTPEEFLAALGKIKELNPDITPLYTNYASNWAMSNWDFVRESAAGDPNFTNELTTDKTPFDDGKPMNTIYKLLYDSVKEGYTEADPTTTDWEQSKQDLADGKVAAMVLGSWAIEQVQALAENPEDIQFAAFPTTHDGKQYTAIGGDYNIGINVNSEHKEAARTFLDWFVDESNYAADTGGISPKVGADLPAALKSMETAGVEFFQATPAPAGKESLFADINNSSEIGLGTTDATKQRIVDAAKGNTKESFDDIMKELNEKWGNAIEEVGQ
ncbi:extracellular solute-binding protein [Niallia circulans]|jgi:raffinose/stachyose/melibiose transport system substrate-binding protein|uniref:ABC transporter substrate-binding protein n=1 Tax=Niallia TaxID=2837506 RepID=UPI000AA96271|nr:extracellular solute-binding protein [Niallia circulans]